MDNKNALSYYELLAPLHRTLFRLFIVVGCLDGN